MSFDPTGNIRQDAINSMKSLMLPVIGFGELFFNKVNSILLNALDTELEYQFKHFYHALSNLTPTYDFNCLHRQLRAIYKVVKSPQYKYDTIWRSSIATNISNIFISNLLNCMFGISQAKSKPFVRFIILSFYFQLHFQLRIYFFQYQHLSLCNLFCRSDSFLFR